MARPESKAILTLTALLVICSPAWSAVMQIGGPGCVSTSDPPWGALALLCGGEKATADVEFDISSTDDGAVLTLCVTNTSPAVPGADMSGIADAPVICDVLFGVPEVVTGMSLRTVNGAAAASSGWYFEFDPDSCPGTGFGFLRSDFDGWLAGGPPGKPAPVIASIYDPDITDGPGDAVASPVYFVFLLGFGGAVPSGFSADSFCDGACMGDPEYMGAGRFMSGANGGSGTVTASVQQVVPAPGAAVLLLAGLAGLAVGRRRQRP